jgi:serine protease Do
MAAAMTAWLAVSATGSQVLAAEVDAVGASAPLGFADVIEKVKPAVAGVRIKIEGLASSSDTQQESRPPAGSPVDRFFRQFGTPVPDSPAPRSATALGSGLFVSGDGYVVTNNHVVANGTSFEVTTDDGKTYQAAVVGTDPETDVALIKVSASTDFPT